MLLLLSPVPWLRLMLKEQMSAPTWDHQVLSSGTGKLGAWGVTGSGRHSAQKAGIRPPVAQIKEFCPIRDLVVDLSLSPAFSL